MLTHADSVTSAHPSAGGEQRPKPRRSWRAKFGDAFRGLKFGVRGHSSFFVHFFFTAMVLTAALVLRCDAWQWALLVLCIGGVLTAELFNSAIETLFRGLPPEMQARSFRSLDIAAGAVLLASIVAALIGGAIFFERLMKILE